MKKLMLIAIMSCFVQAAFAQIELTIKGFPFFNSAGFCYSSDWYGKNLGARSGVYALAFYDFGTLSITKNKTTCYSITGGAGIVGYSDNIERYLTKRYGEIENLAGYIDDIEKYYGFLTLEKVKLTKKSLLNFDKRNKLKFFTGVYRGVFIGFNNIDLWNELAYSYSKNILTSYVPSSIIPINFEVGYSRYYLLRTNAKRFNIGCDFKMFALFQLPKFTRLVATTFNSDFRQTTTSYHLAMPMVRVGVQASIPSLTFTLKRADKMKKQ